MCPGWDASISVCSLAPAAEYFFEADREPEEPPLSGLAVEAVTDCWCQPCGRTPLLVRPRTPDGWGRGNMVARWASRRNGNLEDMDDLDDLDNLDDLDDLDDLDGDLPQDAEPQRE